MQSLCYDKNRISLAIFLAFCKEQDVSGNLFSTSVNLSLQEGTWKILHSEKIRPTLETQGKISSMLFLHRNIKK